MQPTPDARRQNPEAMAEPGDAQRFQAQDEDAEAVRRVLAGDVSAFEGIVRRWQVRLLCSVRRNCAG